MVLAFGTVIVAGCGGGAEDDTAAPATSTEAATGATEPSGETTTEEAATSGATSPVGDSIAAAQQLVDESVAPVAFQPPGPAFTPASDLAGKKVYLIPNFLAGSTFWQSALSGLEEAAGLFDVEIVSFDPAGNIGEVARGIDEAISQDAAAIILGSLDSEALSEPIREATSAGIAVIMENDTPSPSITPEQEALGIFGNVAYCQDCAGRMLAALSVVQSGDDVNAVSVRSPEISASKGESDGFIAGMQEFCPTCPARTVDVPIAEWSTQLGPAATSIVADTAVNYMVPTWCDMVPLMLPAVNAANAQDRVKLLCQGTNTQILDLVKAGEVSSVVGTVDPQWGWNGFDQVLRALSGQPPADESWVPLRMFTDESVESLDLDQPQLTWFGVDLRAGFEQLWGLSS